MIKATNLKNIAIKNKIIILVIKVSLKSILSFRGLQGTIELLKQFNGCILVNSTSDRI